MQINKLEKEKNRSKENRTVGAKMNEIHTNSTKSTDGS